MFLCYFLRKKDSKSRAKVNSSPGLIRAYGRTDGRGRLPNFLGLMDLPIPIAMDAPLLLKILEPVLRSVEDIYNNNNLSRPDFFYRIFGYYCSPSSELEQLKSSLVLTLPTRAFFLS